MPGTGFNPSGFDRAIGPPFAGTATPPAAVIRKPSGILFEESPNSPEIERGEQGTIVKTFPMDDTTATMFIQNLGRGDIMVDSAGVITRILSAKYQQGLGNTATLSITAESLSFSIPPDEFTVETLEFNPSLFRHPRYASVVNYTTGPLMGPQIVAIIQGATNLPQLSSQSEAQALLTSSQISDAPTLALAQELFQKIQRGFDTFYLAGFKVTWSQFNWQPIDMNPGGYIEDPVSAGGLPNYFWADSSGNNILTHLAATVAPQFYSGGLSWLRQADTETYQRTWFKITRTWIGGANGTWDAQIYSKTPRSYPSP